MKQAFILFISILSLVFTASGQINTGSLRGQVKDVANAFIVGATVTVTDKDGKQQTAQTDESGSFNFKNLPIGKYTVRAENAGFAVYEKEDVRVTANRNRCSILRWILKPSKRRYRLLTKTLLILRRIITQARLF